MGKRDGCINGVISLDKIRVQEESLLPLVSNLKYIKKHIKCMSYFWKNDNPPIQAILECSFHFYFKNKWN